MLQLARMGASILPCMPGFYQHPKTVEDLVQFVVAKALDRLGVEHRLGARWGESEPQDEVGIEPPGGSH
jgi:4-hydroxy-3-polyprenylbenzoate decarboxylase